MTCQMTMSLGVYVLGAADPAERARVAAHLPGCRECQAELADLTPLPGLLTLVPQDMRPAAARPAGEEPGRAGGESSDVGGPASRGTATPSPAAAPRGVARARGSARARRPATGRVTARLRGYHPRPVRAAAAAAAAAVAAGFALGYWLMPASSGAGPGSITFTGVNPATHVVATAALTPTSWGTSIQLRLRGIPLNEECRLVARSRTGATEVTGVWDAWSAGPVSVPASAGWRAADITSLQVVAGTKALVTIDTSGRPAAAAHSQRRGM